MEVKRWVRGLLQVGNENIRPAKLFLWRRTLTLASLVGLDRKSSRVKGWKAQRSHLLHYLPVRCGSETLGIAIIVAFN